MVLNRVRFGDYINLIKIKCGVQGLTPNDVSGINKDKEFFEPSKQVGNDTSNYKIVPPSCFACNIMHVGRDVVLPIALNNSGKNKIVSPAYTVFEWRGNDVLLKEYLFMMLKSSEMDRFFWFHCDSSVRDGMDWDAFCDIEVEVPPIDIQNKYVKIYESLLLNLNSYEKNLGDFKLVCDGYIENLRKNSNKEKLSNYIEEINVKNDNETVKYAIGISMNGVFESERTAKKDSIKGCKIVEKNNILWASQTTCGIGLGAIGIYEKDIKAICAPTCTIIKTKNGLDPYYLLTWLRRKEFWRYAKFVGSGVVEKFDSVLMGEVEIPIPNQETQKCVRNMYIEMNKRIRFINEIKEKIQELCPILIRGSINEANGR